MCRECGDYVAATETVFLKHIKSKHVKTRTKTNHNIVTRLLYNVVEPVHNNHWEEGLAWLSTHTPDEPNFCQLQAGQGIGWNYGKFLSWTEDVSDVLET